MAHIPRILCKTISRVVPSGILFKMHTPFFLPFYHVVSNKDLPYVLNYPHFNEKQFEQHLDFYLSHFKPVSLEYLYHNPNPSEKVFHLSFDDGLKQCADFIAPILLRKGIPATFFVNSGFVDNKELFHRYKASLLLTQMHLYPDTEAESLLLENKLTRNNLLRAGFSQRSVLDEAADLLELDFDAFLEKEKPYLTTQQLVDLSNKGFTIGGHSHKHPEFWKISEKKQFKQVRKNMKWIDENVKQKIKAFSFPYTDDKISTTLFQRIKAENICDLTFGTAGIKHDKIKGHFQRYPVEQEGDFQQNLKAEFIYFGVRKIFGKASVKH